MDTSVSTWVLGLVPVLLGLIWWWNEIWYVTPVKARLVGTCKKLPPGHMGLPLLGELITFLWYFKIRRRPDDYINSKRKRYGDGTGLYKTYIFGYPTIIACTPESSKFVLHSDDAFSLQRWPSIDLLGQDSIISASGPAHKRLRRFVSEAINQPRALDRIALLNQPSLLAQLRSWADKGTVLVHDEFRKFNFESICKLFVSLEPNPLMDKMECYYQGIIKGMRANPLRLPGTAFHRGLQCRKNLLSVFREELQKRKREEQYGSVEARNDLMDGLRQIKFDNGDLLTDDEVVDNILSFVLGGHEPIVVSASWAVFYLAKHPRVLQKLREENMAISKKKSGEYVTRDDISQMKYTKQVIEETLRMCNVSAFVFRMGDKDVEFQGQIIPKHWKVICWLRYLHTDARNFEDPLCFNPDRWNDDVKPSQYQAFGMGSRICVGDMFARMQLALFLHHLSTGYKWELVNPDAEVLYLPNPIPVDKVKISIQKID